MINWRASPAALARKPDDTSITALMSKKPEDVGGPYLLGVLLDCAEEGLQVEGDRSQGVGPRTTGHERQVAIKERIAERVAGLSRWQKGLGQLRWSGRLTTFRRWVKDEGMHQRSPVP